MRGVIDLVFCHNDVYYLLDWKTNWLGKNASDYTEDAMRKELIQHRYDKQAELYTQALQKHIGKNASFGGFFFIFLRAFLEEVEGYGVLHLTDVPSNQNH